ncbi:hypothetical protein HRI_000129200 [Hibiscus trionum]|uniref:SAGA-associated factor 11 n=1 Tax=Hibiscus trionum TaxID=183268 RepID=A0A9W7GS07_HIBTR|nr:hypothetical protein HRI_000129200 [Hibiscus trionum]
MVCPLGSGRMTVMARLLEPASISPSIAEDVVNKKLAAQYIYRELRGADEANLLDEEDMHVFGLKPMTDPLNLVRCNACKKPVMASQYAAHAELCRSLKITEEIILELDGGTGHRKPPRKERKKSLAAYANQPTLVGDQERSEIIDADDDTTASESLKDGQIGTSSSLTVHAKRNSTCTDMGYLMDGSGISPQNTGQSTSVVPPSAKRFKLPAGDRLPLLEEPKPASGMKRILNSHDLYASMGFPIGMVSGSDIPTKALENCQLTKDPPAPLSTKMYYSQRNSRLRLALSHQYFITPTKELCNDKANRQVPQQSTTMLQDSSQGVSPLEQVDNLLTEKQESSQQKPDQDLAQISELCSSKSERYLLSNDFSNPHPVDNIPRPQADSVGLSRSKYVPEHSAFSGNSDKLLGPLQPPNGSVPVV